MMNDESARRAEQNELLVLIISVLGNKLKAQ